MNKRIILLTLGAVGLTSASLYGWQWWTVDRFVETTDNAYLQSDISIISPKIQGYVKEVRVADNQTIKADDVLAVVEDRDFLTRFHELAAGVDAQSAALNSLEARLSYQRSKIEQAEAEEAAAIAEQGRAQLDAVRYRSLATTDFTSRQRLETAEADLKKANAGVLKARAALATERNQIGVLEASRAEMTAALRQAEAKLDQARIDLENTVIRSPVAGVVGNRAVRVGEYVKAGTQLMSIVPLPDVYVVANFKETQLKRLMPGQSVEIRVDALSNTIIEGKVESMAPASGAQFSLLPPENATGNFTKVVQRIPVRIAIPTGDPAAPHFRPGLSVVVSVDTRSDEERSSANGLWAALADTAKQSR